MALPCIIQIEEQERLKNIEKRGLEEILDTRWIDDAKRGNREAMLKVLRALEQPLYQTAFYILGNEQDALDVTQESLITIFRHLSTYRGESSLATWAQRIVTNKCYDFLRKQKKEREVVALWKQRERFKHTFAEQAGFATDLQQAIAMLPPLQRTVVTLRYIQDYDYITIAEILELPLNTVKSHLYRARKTLKVCLIDYREGRKQNGS